VTQTIPVIGLFPLTLTFGDQLVGSTSATQSVTLVNTGSAALTIGTITTTGDFTHPSKTCGTSLRSGSSCTISVAFAPKSAAPLTGTLTVGRNGTVALSGTGILASVSLTLVPSSNPSVYGQAVTFTATLTSTGSISGGTVNFASNGTTIAGCGTVKMVTDTATCTTSKLAGGADTITATYSGSADDSSASTQLQQTVSPAQLSMTLTSSANPVLPGIPVTLTAIITGNGSLPVGGQVTFTNSSTGATVGSAGVNSAGTAALSTATLPVGTNTITASYPGNADFSSASAQIIQAVPSTTFTLSIDGGPSEPVTSFAFLSGTTGSGKNHNDEAQVTIPTSDTFIPVLLSDLGNDTVVKQMVISYFQNIDGVPTLVDTVAFGHVLITEVSTQGGASVVQVTFQFGSVTLTQPPPAAQTRNQVRSPR
jgi:hypothetical protein